MQGAPFSGDRSVLSASIRGVGQDDFAFNLNPAVGVYLDGVYLARTIGANQGLLDVDRVEILKGPQGTLFGANTEGGAISIITHTPGNEQKFTGQVTGGSLNRRDIGFTADIPLIKDTLLSSITVSSQDRDGYQKVIPYPSQHAARLDSRSSWIRRTPTRRRATRPVTLTVATTYRPCAASCCGWPRTRPPSRSRRTEPPGPGGAALHGPGHLPGQPGHLDVFNPVQHCASAATRRRSTPTSRTHRRLDRASMRFRSARPPMLDLRACARSPRAHVPGRVHGRRGAAGRGLRRRVRPDRSTLPLTVAGRAAATSAPTAPAVRLRRARTRPATSTPPMPTAPTSRTIITSASPSPAQHEFNDDAVRSSRSAAIGRSPGASALTSMAPRKPCRK